MLENLDKILNYIEENCKDEKLKQEAHYIQNRIDSGDIITLNFEDMATEIMENYPKDDWLMKTNDYMDNYAVDLWSIIEGRE